jgi:hypothetical protein
VAVNGIGAAPGVGRRVVDDVRVALEAARERVQLAVEHGAVHAGLRDDRRVGLAGVRVARRIVLPGLLQEPGARRQVDLAADRRDRRAEVGGR